MNKGNEEKGRKKQGKDSKEGVKEEGVEGRKLGLVENEQGRNKDRNDVRRKKRSKGRKNEGREEE